MNTQPPPALFSGIDWGSQLHQVCLRASDGAVLGEKAFSHSGQGTQPNAGLDARVIQMQVLHKLLLP